jgi:hypothetical protein
MKYSHEVLEKLIHHIGDKPESNYDFLLIVDYKNLNNLISEETEKMKKYLTRKSFPIKNERSFELLVHQYQEIIVSWLDKVLKISKEEKPRYSMIVYELIIEELQQLLSFINKRFENFFNYEQKAPDVHVELARQKLKKRIELFENHLLEEGINKEVLHLIMQRLHNFLCEKSYKKFRYRELDYLEKFVEYCLGFRNTNRVNCQIEEGPFIELLIFINFNSAGVASNLIGRILNKLNDIESREIKLEVLFLSLKKYNQLAQKKGMIYNCKCASLKEQIIAWIQEEINFIEKKQTNEVAAATKEKLHLSISVDVLSIIARAAKDSKLIINKEKSEMYKNLSTYVRTKNAENLSVNSMIKKSYVADRSSKETAIDVLHDLIKRIHGY